MSIWIYAIISVFIVSLISFVGIITLTMKKSILDKALLFLISVSAGALLGGAFIHLIPESFENFTSSLVVSLLILGGILLFFILEKLIHWRHCHVPTSSHHPHHLALMNLIGDGLHNFIDGLIIGASYLINIPLGITTTLAVVLHEIPQEIGDFGVLLYSGFSKSKALIFNFLSALVAVLGTVIALVIGVRAESFSILLLPIAAGGFIYIASADIMPELHKTCEPSKSLFHLIGLIIGIALMLVLVLFG
jgi:zinc and cadmium transporter